MARRCLGTSHCSGRGTRRHSDRGISAAAGHRLGAARSPTAAGTAGLCRALPPLRRVAAEGLAATWLRWQQEPRWPHCMLMSRDKALTAGALRTATGSGDRRRGVRGGCPPSSRLARVPCQRPAPCDLRTRVGNSGAASTRVGAARCRQPRAPSPARFVTQHFKTREGCRTSPSSSQLPSKAPAALQGCQPLSPGRPRRAVGRTRGLPTTSLIVPVLQQAQGRAQRHLLGPTSGLLV